MTARRTGCVCAAQLVLEFQPGLPPAGIRSSRRGRQPCGDPAHQEAGRYPNGECCACRAERNRRYWERHRARLKLARCH